MQKLSTVLPNMQHTASENSLQTSLSVTQPRSLIKSVSGMTTGQMMQASQPRQTAISSDRAKQAWLFLKQLKSQWKMERTFNAETNCWMHRSSYTIPEGMTHAQVCAGLIEMIRPCSPTITAHFAKLLAFKPMFDVDETRIKIIFETLYDDLKDYPEVAVVLALDDLRKAEGKYWPDTHTILKVVSEYRQLIKDALDYFQQGV